MSEELCSAIGSFTALRRTFMESCTFLLVSPSTAVYLEGLTNDTHYEIQVMAYTNAAVGSASPPVVCHTPPLIPAAPPAHQRRIPHKQHSRTATNWHVVCCRQDSKGTHGSRRLR
nr:uncharacterized protein LOC113802899 [Penaeus vannamei]